MIICCQDFENLTVVGDVNKDSVANIWMGKAFNDFRKKYLAKDLKGTLCVNCLFNKKEQVKPLTDNYNSYSIDERKREKIKKRIETIKNFPL